MEYAKAGVEDICVRVTIANRGPEAAEIHLLPTLWFRNTWSWYEGRTKPSIAFDATSGAVHAQEREIGSYWLYADQGGTPLFTENETNNQRLFNSANSSPYVKDAFHRWTINGERDAVNPALQGTKAAIHYKLTVPAGGERIVNLRLQKGKTAVKPALALGAEFKKILRSERRKPTNSTPL